MIKFLEKWKTNLDFCPLRCYILKFQWLFILTLHGKNVSIILATMVNDFLVLNILESRMDTWTLLIKFELIKLKEEKQILPPKKFRFQYFQSKFLINNRVDSRKMCQVP